MFVFSKIAWTLVAPDTVFALVVVAAFGLGASGRRRGAVFLGACAAVFAVAVLSGVLPHLVASPLEERFPQQTVEGRLDGIVVLGGAMQPYLSSVRDQPAVNGAAERMTTFVALARSHPQAELVFSGGSGSVLFQQYKEGVAAVELLARIGFPVSRVVVEASSRNTFENALMARDAGGYVPGQRWALITSAMHMPRAVAAFRKAGWTGIVPVPVDYRTTPDYVFDWQQSFAANLELTRQATKEWAGLAVYRLTGRSDDFFPAPR
jgi:uncharacterized SAM-binding protein YcdF (DUF218 family)